jgi:hypothetical protein
VVPEDEQRVPGGGAKTRVPNLRHALGNPARREILRVLNDAGEAKTAMELADLVPAVKVSSLKYHLLVLEKESCVSRAGELALANGMAPTYVASVGDDQFVIDILNGTRGEDPGRGGG